MDVKVVCKLSRKRERVLLESPLTEETLPLLTPKSALAAMLIEGAGQRYVPTGIAVYVDGKLRWEASCHTGADTSLRGVRHTGESVQAVPFSVLAANEANEGREFDAERLASNRLADTLSRTDYGARHWADEVAEELVSEAGSLRPKLTPVKPEPEAPFVHRPYPLPYVGQAAPLPGGRYQPVSQVTPEDMQIGYRWESF